MFSINPKRSIQIGSTDNFFFKEMDNRYDYCHFRRKNGSNMTFVAYSCLLCFRKIT